MLPKNVIEKLQDNFTKPSFTKSLSHGETWKSKSMRIVPEEFLRDTQGAYEHSIVLCNRLGDSWHLWVEKDKKGFSFMVEEDWDEFVDDNNLDPNVTLFFHHQDSMFLHVRIIRKDENDSEQPLSSHQETTSVSASVSVGSANGRVRPVLVKIENPERYLVNPESPFFVKTITKKNDVLYMKRPAISKYGLKFGPVDSEMKFILPNGVEEIGANKVYGNTPCFTGWIPLCRKHGFKLGDNLVCELERSSDGVVNAVRLHLVKE